MSAAAKRHLRVVEVNDGTGEIEGTVDVEALVARVEKLEHDRRALEKDIRAKRRRITELERDKAQERLEHPQRDLIVRIANYWHRKCRGGDAKVNPLSVVRFDAVAALVEMTVIVADEKGKRHEPRYRPEDFKQAIDGAAFDHYAKQRKNGSWQHFDDLELVCRDSKQFEEFRARAPQA